MSFTDPPLSINRLRAALAGQRFGREIQLFEQCDSTNDLVKISGKNGHPDGLVIFAESQNAGRGRWGKSWHSPPRKGLLFSLLLRPKYAPERWATLTMTAALSICKTFDQLQIDGLMIKWPNDIYHKGKKLGGILAETFWQNGEGFVVLGIGLNINQTLDDFHFECQETSTSSYLITDHFHDRTEIAIQLLKKLGQNLSQSDDLFSNYHDEIKQRCFLLGQKVCAQQDGTVLEGIAHDITADGSLWLKTDNGTEKGALIKLTYVDQIRLKTT